MLKQRCPFIFLTIFVTLFITVFIPIHPLQALELGGVILPDTLSAEATPGQTDLILNGAGIRKKFGFKVYVAGLYLKAKTTDSNEIIQTNAPMAIIMTWKRNGPEKKIKAVFSKGFSYAATNPTDTLKAEIAGFLKTLPEANKNDVWKLMYTPKQGTAVYYNDQHATTIAGLEFKKALFGVWLLETDNFTGDKKLRKGMLGK